MIVREWEATAATAKHLAAQAVTGGDPQLALAIYLAAHGGARLREIPLFQWRDLDNLRGLRPLVHIPTTRRQKSRYGEWPPRLPVPIDDPVCAREMWSLAALCRLQFAGECVPDDPVFAHPAPARGARVGRAWHFSTTSDRWWRLLRRLSFRLKPFSVMRRVFVDRVMADARVARAGWRAHRLRLRSDRSFDGQPPPGVIHGSQWRRKHG